MSAPGTYVKGIVVTVSVVSLVAAVGRSLRAVSSDRPVSQRSRRRRNVELAGLGVNVGSAYATARARKLFASAERRVEIDEALRLRTAEQVAARLGNMKGALMKVGQMASYLDDGLPEPVRQALAELQANAPPMSDDLAAEVVERELGAPPEKVFVEWDPVPIASASIGQVHRAVVADPATGTERAVAVKVQYPGVDEAIESDLRNTELLGMLLRQGFSGLDPTEMSEEIRDRLTEEVDYRIEAINQQHFADYYRGHPYISVPDVLATLSTGRVLTSELVAGHTWRELLTWDAAERDLAAECLFRFVFRSLYRMRAFNGDPHPGNYLFHGDGHVTFLDFGLVKYFTDDETATFAAMVKAAAVDHDTAGFRRLVEHGGLLPSGIPVSTEDVGDYFSQFYEPVREDRTMTWTKEYASTIVRHTFDRSSPIAQYATVPRAFVFIQRINLGLYALLGDLGATGNYRRIAEELWPFVDGPPSTQMGEREAEWLARR
ncbi:MAG: AarF/ABC1/UbiB kinase family protein [Actinomycetota bacterium]|nr:AarF/ABC1/UbiB kinase family protein [Actinomycetota bacterium]